MKLGIICRSDTSGLGFQTRNLCRMLKPYRVLLINSTMFNRRKQHSYWYKEYGGLISNGFPNTQEIRAFLNGLDAVLTCETPYNWQIFSMARRKGIRTYLQYNWEFLEHLQNNSLPLPTMFIAPSKWYYDTMIKKFSNTIYLPPPTFPEDFQGPLNTNLARKGKKRFVHIAGRKAARDRNGTELLTQAIRYCKEDFELVVKSQYPLVDKDARITYDESDPEEQAGLYQDFDALIMPRRYGGLCMPMNEALLAGLPVIMPDISPNNDILPKRWLVEAKQDSVLLTKTVIPLFKADVKALARMLDELAVSDLTKEKRLAYDIGLKNFSDRVLEERWHKILR